MCLFFRQCLLPGPEDSDESDPGSIQQLTKKQIDIEMVCIGDSSEKSKMLNTLCKRKGETHDEIWKNEKDYRTLNYITGSC